MSLIVDVMRPPSLVVRGAVVNSKGVLLGWALVLTLFARVVYDKFWEVTRHRTCFVLGL